ncbi:unnamed protein product [Lactuca virosa]|uniref:Uncharacterized protein n=1 Tax=Lactuca virosa TaxID=75947 RepID=A0AAU9PBM7_9ASTR|nr:unnamed protein product [Lactuca virosa]
MAPVFGFGCNIGFVNSSGFPVIYAHTRDVCNTDSCCTGQEENHDDPTAVSARWLRWLDRQQNQTVPTGLMYTQTRPYSPSKNEDTFHFHSMRQVIRNQCSCYLKNEEHGLLKAREVLGARQASNPILPLGLSSWFLLHRFDQIIDSSLKSSSTTLMETKLTIAPPPHHRVTIESSIYRHHRNPPPSSAVLIIHYFSSLPTHTYQLIMGFHIAMASETLPRLHRCHHDHHSRYSPHQLSSEQDDRVDSSKVNLLYGKLTVQQPTQYVADLGRSPI